MGRGNQQIRWLEYDAVRHRLWILGQRCHHGATGVLVAGTACLGLLSGQPRSQAAAPRSLVALALAGGALMAHDWKDHSVWFSIGAGERD
jgi:hypothetical protein